MIEAILAPVALHHRDVEIPALTLRLAFADRLHGARTERDRRQARRTTQAFLRATVDRIDFPFVEIQRNAAQRGDGIDHQQRIELVAQFAEFFDGLPGAGRGLRLDDGQHLGSNLRQNFADALQIEYLAPGTFEPR